MNHGLLNGLFIVSLTILFLVLLLKKAETTLFYCLYHSGNHSGA